MKNISTQTLYIAAPVRDENPNVTADRQEESARFGAWLMQEEGCTVFAAPAHNALMVERFQKSFTSDWLIENVIQMIEKLDAVAVLCLDGWKESNGVATEIETAKKFGKSVFYYEKQGEGYARVSF